MYNLTYPSWRQEIRGKLMSADALYQSFLNYLDVRITAIDAGAEVAVGEDFTLRVTVQNIASRRSNYPKPAFRNVQVIVTHTDYADHQDVASNTVIRDLEGYVTSLTSGESGSVDFSMIAKQAIGNSTIPGFVQGERI